jgi:predicted DNA-binding protein (UPF0251 family)
MSSASEDDGPSRRKAGLTRSDRLVVEQFSRLVTKHIELLVEGPDRIRLVDLAKRAVSEARASLGVDSPTIPDQLPVSKLKASDVVAERWVDISQASLYRAVESKRLYCTTPKGRSIGKEFPSWQFIQPVPELIAPVLALLADHPSSEIHAFWVSAVDELNELSPAEVLAGKPFETRREIHRSQQAIMDLPTSERVRKVVAAAEWHHRGMSEPIG